MKKPIIYFVPLLIALAVIGYRDYQFYWKQAAKIFKYVKFDVGVDQYEQIQQHHPYYEIYLAAKSYKDKTDYKLIYYSNKTGKNYLDYNSTLYATRKNPNGKPVEKYMSEVGLMINYFFYPRLVPVTYSSNLIREIINSHDRKYIIISDSDLQLGITGYKNVRRIHDPAIDSRKIYKPVEPFFIYQII